MENMKITFLWRFYLINDRSFCQFFHRLPSQYARDEETPIAGFSASHVTFFTAY